MQGRALVLVLSIVVLNVFASLCMLSSTYALYLKATSVQHSITPLIVVTNRAITAACSIALLESNERILRFLVGHDTLNHVLTTCQSVMNTS